MIKDAEGNTIGEVTSGTQSPSLNKAIGMGYVAASHSKVDSEIFIEIREKMIKAKVVKIPFL
jgi:aminomethyltransferase